MEGVVVLLFISLAVVTSKDINVEDYLNKYGYHNPFGFDGSSLSNSIKKYQKTFGIPETGVADQETIKLMTKPRCGLSDHGYNNAFSDSKWSKNVLTYHYHNYSPDLSQSELKKLTKRAFKYWSDVTPLVFNEVQQNGDIVIAYGQYSHYDGRRQCDTNFDGASGVLAHAFFPPDGRMHFDDSEKYTSNSGKGINYLWVTTHELGHILGLDHDAQNRNAVMYPIYRSYDPNGMNLHQNDVYRIQLQYGRKPVESQTQPPVNTQPSTTQTPSLDCKDISYDCHKYVKRCDNYTDGWKSWMDKYCRKSCNKCGVKRACKDESSNCASYVANCNVDGGGWKGWMKSNCYKTCRYC